MKHLLFLSLVVLAVILPHAVQGFFPIAVALGVGAILIAKGIFLGALIGAASRGNQRSYNNYGYGRSYNSYGYSSPYTYTYYRRGRRSALRDVSPKQLSSVERDQWFTDMSSQDQDDCGKRMVCELTARHTLNATSLADDERAIVMTFIEKIDVTKGQVEFLLASKIGMKDGELRCAELYRTCNVATDTTMTMIRAELQEINKISRSPSFINKVPSDKPQKPLLWLGRQ